MENTTNQLTEGFNFYVLPEEMLKKMEDGEIYSEEDLNSFKMSEPDIELKLADGNCYVTGHSSITCQCTGFPPTRTGSCEIYYKQVGTNLVYCYTRCQSCYYVCGGG